MCGIAGFGGRGNEFDLKAITRALSYYSDENTVVYLGRRPGAIPNHSGQAGAARLQHTHM